MKKYLLLLLAAVLLPSAAQSQGCTPTNASPGTWSSDLHMPADVPGVTATLWLTDSSGNIVGHNATITPGTTVTLNTSSTGHLTSASMTYKWISGLNKGASGYWPYGTYTAAQADAGSVVVFTYADSDGSASSQDRDTITVQSGSDGIITSDGLASNFYLHVTSSLNGTPAYNWADCHMTGMESATHQPSATVKLGNTASGEMHSQVRVDGPVQAAMTGQTVNPLSVQADDWISVTSWDLADPNNMQIQVDSWFICSSAGQEWTLPNINLVLEVAITASEIMGAGVPVPGHPGWYSYPVESFCQDGRDPHFPNSKPPDWNPSHLVTSDAPPGLPNYWLGYTSCGGFGLGGYVPFFECLAELMDNTVPGDVPAPVALLHGFSIPYTPSDQQKAAGGVSCTNYNNKIYSKASTTLQLPPVF